MRNPKAVALMLRMLGANMQRLRPAADLTQKEAADRAGLHWRHWQKIESGTCNICVSSLVGIAYALDVTIGELFTPPPR
jgi:transcriptional regulator with XRE-family HTH domain